MSNNDCRSIHPRHLRLFRAARAGDVLLLETLFAEGSDVNVRNAAGLSALHFAAAGGQEQAVRILLTYGAEVNAASDLGLTALMIAARDGYVEIVKLLLEAGADTRTAINSVPEAYGHAGRSAMTLAMDRHILMLLERR